LQGAALAAPFVIGNHFSLRANFLESHERTGI
jgi:hypothetical protein